MTCRNCEKTKEKVKEVIRLLSPEVDDYFGVIDLLYEILGKGKSKLHYLIKDAKSIDIMELLNENTIINK